MKTKITSNEIEKFLRAEILGDPTLSSPELENLDKILTTILAKCNNDQKKRDELLDFLERWKIRTLFVEALQKEYEKLDKR